MLDRAVWLSLLLSGSALLTAQDPVGNGEPLPRAAIGAGVVETMAEVVRRDRERPPQPRVVEGERNGRAGTWIVPARKAATARPHSGERFAINRWGDPRIGIAFGRQVTVTEAWFAAQGGQGSAATAVRVIGYRDGTEVGRTEWLTDLAGTPRRLAIDLLGVDRIEVEARPGASGSGWFALDDLVFGEAAGERVVVDFEDVAWRTTLTGSGYRGLRWETGAGAFAQDPQGDRVRAIPPPQQPPGVRDFATDPDPGGAASSTAGGGTLPNVTWSVAGPKIFDPGSAVIPPDSSGAAGIDHYLALPNSNLSVYDKVSKARVVNVALASFFALPNGVGIGDVRSLFDPDSQRFVLAAMTGTYGRIYVAVSATSDPTGAWFKTSFLAASGSDADKWPDFPTLGVDANGIYLAALMVGGSYPMTIWALDKAPMVAANPSLGTVTAWRNLVWEGAIQPALTYGDAGGEFLLSRANSIALRVRKITGPLTAPTLTDLGGVSVPWQDSPPNAPALGSTTNVSTGDFRPAHAMWRDGSLWFAQGTNVAGRAAVRWYELDTATLRIAQSGTISDPSLYYFYPAIAVNARGEAMMSFNGADANQYVGIYYVGRLPDDPPGEMSPVTLLRSGVGSYERVDGNGTNRWGDYAYSSVDPVDGSLWTIQEYPIGNNNWGTNIARMEFDWFRYGEGWPGTDGVPDLRVGFGEPDIGSNLLLWLDNSASAPTSGVLLVGFQRASLPIFDGTVLVVPTAAFNQPIADPGQYIGLRIPNDTNLVGASVFLQGIELDAGASQGLSFTCGLELRIGD